MTLPKIMTTISYINRELDELEREDFTRLKMVKKKKEEHHKEEEAEKLAATLAAAALQEGGRGAEESKASNSSSSNSSSSSSVPKAVKTVAALADEYDDEDIVFN